jgi:hypothetical protein
VKTREEHLAWCKQRALEYIDRGQVNEGLTSMMSDMRKHPETESKSGALDQLTVGLMMIGALSTPDQARKHINGYN